MNGPNPILLVRDHIAEHIAELEGEREKLIARLIEINGQLVLARTLRSIVPPLPADQPGAAGDVQSQGLEGASTKRRPVVRQTGAPTSPPPEGDS